IIARMTPYKKPAAQRLALQLPPRRAAQNAIKMPAILRAEGGQLQPPIRHAVGRYGRNCPDNQIIRYNDTTPELRPQHGLARLSLCCNPPPRSSTMSRLVACAPRCA